MYFSQIVTGGVGCREAGVRNLKKHLERIYRKVALKLVKAGHAPKASAVDARQGVQLSILGSCCSPVIFVSRGEGTCVWNLAFAATRPMQQSPAFALSFFILFQWQQYGDRLL
jgi:hypothetical protein